MGMVKGYPICKKQVEMNAEQIWMRDPLLQCEEEFIFYDEIFEFVLEDLKQVKNKNGIITEGVAYLPKLMKELGVPISDSICPEVRLNGSRCRFASCYDRGGRKAYTEYDFYIEMSGHILQNTEKSLRSVLLHELLHTMPEGYDHRGEWKKWAKYVSAKTGYNIQRLDGDETQEDQERLEGRL
jgi:hypothetical protein